MSALPIQPTPDALIKARTQPDLVDVPERVVLALDGAGGPEEPGFAAAIGALYGIAYTIRFTRKKAGLPVFKVGMLEGEWRAEGADLPLHEIPARETWRWRLQMGVPVDVTEAELRAAVEAATGKKRGKLYDSEEARRIRLLQTEPARFGRILHVGPYAAEPESFARLDVWLAEQGLQREPWHVEVYLSDPGRTAPEKLKTTLLVRIC